MKKTPVRFTDSQVGHILKRAAEIDARGDSLDADELRAIAAEAGIDPRATDAAIRELLAEEGGGGEVAVDRTGSSVVGHDARVPARKAGLSLPWRLAAGGAVGAACGFLIGLSSGFAIGDAPWFIGTVTTILYLAARALANMKRGAHFDFQSENLAVWVGAALGSIPALGRFPFFADVMVPLFVAWLLAAVFGGLLVLLGQKDEGATDEPGRIGPGAG